VNVELDDDEVRDVDDNEDDKLDYAGGCFKYSYVR
jgi:hypothetical protein